MKNKIITLLTIFICFATQLNAQEKSYSIDLLTGKQNITTKNKNYNLLNEVSLAYSKMQKDALKEGITIQIVSSFRNFERQHYIFKRKYNAYKKKGLSETQILYKITEYSTIPGTSRHHWGTDFDIVQKVTNMPKSLLNENNFNNQGLFCEMKEWMDLNANKYGFYLVYTNDDNRTGFKYEPWHYSYAPISKKILSQFLLENKKNKIFPVIKNAGVPLNADYYNNYIESHIKGINPLLLSF